MAPVVYREYIGTEAQFDVLFTDVEPIINPNVEFHFIVSSAIDFENLNPTNGIFHPFWKTDNLGPTQIADIKSRHPNNVKVMLSLGGDTNENGLPLSFDPNVNKFAWVSNATSSLKGIIDKYRFDGIDINYKNFAANSDADAFAYCIGNLIRNLKNEGVISSASIAPSFGDLVQTSYLALWGSHHEWIDYVNYQFNTYPVLSTEEFVEKFNLQIAKYSGGKVLPGFGTNGDHGLQPQDHFLQACGLIRRNNNLFGIFAWSADISKRKQTKFAFEIAAQSFLANLN